MKLKKGPLGIGVVVAVIGGGIVGLFITLKERNQAATAIIHSLAVQLELYVTGLQAFVDNDPQDVTVAEQFASINKIVRVGASPWDIHSEADPNNPGVYKIFVSGPPELLVHLQRRLRFAKLPVNHTFINAENGGASLGIYLPVMNPVLVESVRLKLGLKPSL